MSSRHTRTRTPRPELALAQAFDRPPQQLAAFAASIMLIGASGTVGLLAAVEYGAVYGPTRSYVFAVVAVAAAILQPICILGFYQSLRAWRPMGAMICATVAVTCLTYSVAANLWISSKVRSDLIAHRDHAANVLSDHRGDRARFLAQLAGLPAESTLNERISRLLKTPKANRCTRIDGPIRRSVCAEVAKVRATRTAILERRQLLESKIAAADVAIRSVDAPVGANDPLSSAISAYAAAAGLSGWSEENIAPWISLLFPTLLEVGSSLGLVVSATLGHRRRGRHMVPEVLGHLRTPVVAGSKVPESSAPETASGQLGTAILDHVKLSGGVILAGQRELAKSFETSKSELNRVLHQLEREGRVFLSADHRGTKVVLSG